jgi:hypothetical protein
MKLHVPGPLSLQSKASTSIDVQREKLSNGSPKCDTLVRQIQKNANEVLEDQVNDCGEDGDAAARERAALGTLYSGMRWVKGGLVENGHTNATIEVAIENIIDGAGGATHKD